MSTYQEILLVLIAIDASILMYFFISARMMSRIILGIMMLSCCLSIMHTGKLPKWAYYITGRRPDGSFSGKD